jgi:hypothetical protein
MSSDLKAELAPIDPERGNLEPLPLRISVDQRDQRVAVVDASTLQQKKDTEKESEKKETDVAKKEAPKPASKPPAKPKPKVSNWILFNVWFNTYR